MMLMDTKFCLKRCFDYDCSLIEICHKWQSDSLQLTHIELPVISLTIYHYLSNGHKQFFRLLFEYYMHNIAASTHNILYVLL